MQACCEAAVERGLSHICFTDHLEHNPHDGGTGYYRPEAYFNEVRRLQQAYKSRTYIGRRLPRPWRRTMIWCWVLCTGLTTWPRMSRNA